ncbi:hypothetical protein Fmac_020382 [Flemingia macrophylla]|uniref:Uncharacterized protein n=1 Tax=Flemingia macrophylla TaxID=520843 RepID=A0ABD1LTU5_9FABA
MENQDQHSEEEFIIKGPLTLSRRQALERDISKKVVLLQQMKISLVCMSESSDGGKTWTKEV